MKKLKEELKYGKKGITLISLVVTIIVLLILAGITINMLFGENGLLNRATDATEEYSEAEAKEKVELLLSEYVIDKATGENDNFANFLRKNLQVGVAENDDNTYSFMLGEYQVVTDENRVISIEKFKLDVDKTYPNVASMKADTELADGQLVQTESYWDKQYGGSAYYDIVSITSLAVDDGKCIQLDNGLYAELHPINDTVTVNQYGAYGDGEHDDANSIQLALNAGYGNVTFESERYKFGKTIKLSTDNVYVIGNNATLFWDETIVTPWEQIGISGTSEKHVNNIYIMYLTFVNGNISINEDSGESIQLRGSYCDNIVISNCKFNIYEVSENKSRQITNLWFHTEWKNIVVQDCEFKNLTNSNVGGNIWLSDLTSNNNYISQNAIIQNNYIEKSCHDESIGVWEGYIDNVIIQNNEFNIHEENVDNRSTMNFSFGNTGGILTNLQFIDNNVECESKDFFAFINGELGSKNIFIKQNKIRYSIISNNNSYQQMFNQNDNTENVQIESNDIEYNAVNDGVLQVFSNGKSSYINNKIKIIANIKDGFGINDLYDSNKIEIDGNVQDRILNASYNFKNNEITLNGNCPSYIIFISNNLNRDINIQNNKFIINDSNQWTTNSKHLIFLYNISLNNYNININNNVIETPNQTNNQNLIQLHTIHDITPQVVNLNNNNCDIFKGIVFYNNQASHKILIDGKEFTYSTSLQ